MRVAVTGGAGFIGSHFVEHFASRGDQVLVIDNLRSGYRHNLEGLEHSFHELSVTDREALEELFAGVELVVHLAAMVSVPESLEDPRLCVEINTRGTLNVLEAAHRRKVPRLVLASSAAVYGDNPVMPKREQMLPEPKSPYAVTKLDGEYYLRMYGELWGMETVSLRFFNVFGPRQDPHSQYAAAIPIFIDRALRGEDLVIYGDGSQVRDFIFVKDVVRAALLAAEKGSGVYNVARGEHLTLQELVSLLLEITGSSSRVVHEPPRPGDIHTSYADITRIRGLGFVPGTDKRRQLEETVRFFAGKKPGKVPQS